MVLMVLLGWEVVGVTQDGIISLAAIQDSVGLWLPDLEDLRHCPMEEGLGKTD